MPTTLYHNAHYNAFIPRPWATKQQLNTGKPSSYSHFRTMLIEATSYSHFRTMFITRPSARKQQPHSFNLSHIVQENNQFKTFQDHQKQHLHHVCHKDSTRPTEQPKQVCTLPVLHTTTYDHIPAHPTAINKPLIATMPTDQYLKQTPALQTAASQEVLAQVPMKQSPQKTHSVQPGRHQLHIQ